MEELKNKPKIYNTEEVYERAFDSIAESYDDTFESSPVTKRLREIIYGYIFPYLDENSHVLDVNCGTGTDALNIASHGHKVSCLDISPRMVEQARRKLEDFPDVDVRTGSFEDLNTLPSGSFDLILSNFGGLNCTPYLLPVFTRCYELLKPGGRCVLVIMPPVSIWEILSGMRRLNFYHAFRRLRKNPVLNMNNSPVPVYYHSLRRVRKASRDLFNIETVRGLNVLSPPPYSRKFVFKYPNISSALFKLDNISGILPVIRTMGDHMLVVMRKKATG